MRNLAHSPFPVRRGVWLTAFACLLWGAPALASNPHGAPSVEMLREIDFGTLALGGNGGQITVSPNGALSCSGGLQCLGGQSAGAFAITGAKDEIVSIIVSPAMLDDGKGHRLRAVFTPSDRTMVLRPGNAKNPFTMGGTLTASGALVEGSYSGTFDVIVEYQ
ncbi:DUF4402 domain-containing protein [Sphingomonas glacialis]|uniref:DUF4402 domain-containing protein n=1 Tax=Sphingomonas glacialis TaxID=658225 RepID=A0A502G3R9_9SPHN|nr:DUF4402 domain-containing protein [Sphingomonas glacialis]TPG56489.1 DUF4402 domain-containing protein [Sphingomonas glacialis]